MASNFLIGCVGKPSAGKSSFLNAATDANAKVGKVDPRVEFFLPFLQGNYPFTTIEPNKGVTFYQVCFPQFHIPVTFY